MAKEKKMLLASYWQLFGGSLGMSEEKY